MQLIDSHYHLDRELLPVPDLIAAMDRADIGRTALIAAMNEPIAIAGWKHPLLLGYRLLLSADPDGSAHQAGVFLYRHVVERDGTVSVLGDPREIKAQPRNDDVMDAVKAHPDRFFGWIFVNPVGPVDPLTEIDRCRAVPGMIGVKAHPYWHNYAIDRLTDVADRCQGLGLPLLVHLGPEDGAHKLLPELFPRLRIVYAHAGTPHLQEVCSFAGRTQNVFVDLSRPLEYVDLRSARLALRLAGPDKCLFGTDGPYLHEGSWSDFGPSIRVLNGLNLSDRERERVAEKNFLQVIEQGVRA